MNVYLKVHNHKVKRVEFQAKNAHKIKVIPSKHKDVVTTLSQRQALRCIDVAYLFEMNVLPTRLDNVVATLK